MLQAISTRTYKVNASQRTGALSIAGNTHMRRSRMKDDLNIGIHIDPTG